MPRKRALRARRNPSIPLVQVHIGLLANQVGISATNTLDLSQGIHDLLLAIDVGVEESEDELKVRLLTRHERCGIHTSVIQENWRGSSVDWIECRLTHDGRLLKSTGG